MKHYLLFLLFVTPFGLFSQNFYVDGITGNDNNAGTSLVTAWKTIQKACNDASAGSTVWIRGGTYTENLWMNATGTPGNYITFTHYAAETVVIDGGNTNTQTELLNISGPDYIRIDGITFANASGEYSKGMAVRDGSDFIEVVNCIFHDIHFSDNAGDPVVCGTDDEANAFIVYNQNGADACTNIVFSNNEIYNCRTGCSEACTINGNVDGFTITNNMVHDITNIGIDAAGGYSVSPNPANDFARNGLIAGNVTWNCVSQVAVSAGIYVDGGRDIVIEYNTSHDNGRGYEIGCEELGHTTSGILLRNNISYHNEEAGMGIGGYNFPSTTGKVVNCEVRNNTFYDNAFINTGDGEILIEYTENCIIRHNVFYATNPVNRLLSTNLISTGLTLDYNLYYHTAGTALATVEWNGTTHTGFATYQAATGKDAHSLFGNPLLTAPGAASFLPLSGSPVINAGTPGFTPPSGETDFAGNTRLVNTIDIGAFENQLPLPVEYLQGLTATPQDAGVLLRWTVARSVGHHYFDIERSADGSFFEKIGENRVTPGNSAFTPYQFNDQSPLTGINYYRLKQFDNDGQFTYSPVASVTVAGMDIQLVPNPATGQVRITSENLPDYYTLTDITGRQVKMAATDRDGFMDITGITPGIYNVALFFENSGRVVYQKLVIN